MKPETQAGLSKHTSSNLSNSFPYHIPREGESVLCSEDNWIMINAQVIALLPSFDFFVAYIVHSLNEALSFDPN